MREEHQLAASHTNPDQGSNPQPDMCPNQEPNPQPLGYRMTLLPTEPHQPGLKALLNVKHHNGIKVPVKAFTDKVRHETYDSRRKWGEGQDDLNKVKCYGNANNALILPDDFAPLFFQKPINLMYFIENL